MLTGAEWMQACWSTNHQDRICVMEALGWDARAMWYKQYELWNASIWKWSAPEGKMPFISQIARRSVLCTSLSMRDRRLVLSQPQPSVASVPDTTTIRRTAHSSSPAYSIRDLEPTSCTSCDARLVCPGTTRANCAWSRQAPATATAVTTATVLTAESPHPRMESSWGRKICCSSMAAMRHSVEKRHSVIAFVNVY